MDKLNTSHKKFFIVLIILVAIIGMYFGMKWLIFRINYVYTDDAQIAGNLIPISPKVAGKIKKLYFEEGDFVKKGELLVKIDDEDYRLALKRAELDLDGTKRELEKAISQLALTEARIKAGISQAGSSLSQSDEGVKISLEEEKLQEDKLNKDIEKAEINLKIARERIVEAKVNFENAEIEYKRMENLFQEKTIPTTQRDKAKTSYETAKSKLEQAIQGEKDAIATLELAKSNLNLLKIKRRNTKIAEDSKKKAESGYELAKSQEEEIGVAKKTVDVLKAKVKEKTVQLELAKINLKETEIFSPISGIISKKISQNYEYVVPGKPIYFINDPNDITITANIDENNIRKIKVGSKVRIWIDAFPKKEFSGFVKAIGSATNSQFSLIPASNPSGQFIKVSQRIPVKIEFNKIPIGVKLGMMVEVAIKLR